MNMNTETMPLVTFGKYKGKPVTDLLADTAYVEWCKKQDWFQKYPIVYNICVNQTITTSNQNSKTPEHNRLQNLFLERENVKKIIKETYKKFRYQKNINIESCKIEFEGLFNWDLIISDIVYNKSNCIHEWEKKECDCDPIWYSIFNIYIEIKPCLGDDYPTVLRKMKNQIALTEPSLELELRNNGSLSEIRGIQNYHDPTNGKYILLIKDFQSNTTTKEQLIKIFNQTHIEIIFISELFDNLPSQTYSLEEENKILREKIKQLEEEIVSLKPK